MPRKRIGRFAEKVFSHEFADFRGLRQTQGSLYRDQRFVTEMENMRSPERFLESFTGFDLVHRTVGPVLGVGSDTEQVVVAIGDVIAIMTWDEFLNIGTFAFWSDWSPIPLVGGEPTWSDAVPFAFSDPA